MKPVREPEWSRTVADCRWRWERGHDRPARWERAVALIHIIETLYGLTQGHINADARPLQLALFVSKVSQPDAHTTRRLATTRLSRRSPSPPRLCDLPSCV